MTTRTTVRAAPRHVAAAMLLVALCACSSEERREERREEERHEERERDRREASEPAPAPTAEAPFVTIQEAPPEPRQEVIIEHDRPSARHVWVVGCWRHDGRAYVWAPGHWELPPRGMSVWIAPRYERRGGGYVMIDGFWR